ncbi:hypothetical protein C3747_171g103 [Trypanosoma cruzi]|uniref:Uncharacterized protein n=2 Tax=Trypanosoma cruzi TaxID=5693 RepID=Q4DRG0_TRYCC|nr:hypothetical protein, conserved [Trypanosoma cruzi]EAN95103.1 hypothetical protein, conserved [Trypanosoma cruzi]PWV03692.1 hypothetical protein C3747_171g103 [Trypanosoma cruzi]RNC42970.1 hypothetical protein TcCL_NonESM07384 [Trypanosoma cruzi]|eukprot:XP_816954.1 hypothetical protein [Trypanosoma cruzi strain CL Brener]
MIRWAVDLAGVDADADLQRDDRMKLYVGPSSGRKENWKPTFTTFTDPSSLGPVGTVVTLTMRDLIQLQQERLEQALAVNPFGQAGISTFQPKNDTEFLKGLEVRVFSTFTNAQGKRTVCTVQPRRTPFRGVDVVHAFLQQTVVSDDRLSARFSANPRLYKLYIADEFTGEEEMVIQLDGAAQNFTCFAVQPLPAAKLFLFPQRTQLLPSVAEDINLAVEISPLDPQAKTVKSQVRVPADMLAESLEQAIVNLLPGRGLVPGSLRIKYGPVELNINEYYNFGSGCGHMDVPIAERTILSLYRFGVTEVLLQGRIPDENTDVSLLVEDIVVNIDAEEAQAFQQFDVIRINRYGARQQRILCVDGERLYTVRPNVDGSGAAQVNEEKLIKDIEEVVTSPTKSKYLEIRYSRASNHENDHIECTTAYNRALLDEKLRVLQRELRKKRDEERQLKGNDTVFSRLFHRFRLGFHKN